MLGVGQAITTLLHISSLISEYIEFVRRLNTFAFKPCEYCTADSESLEENKLNDKYDPKAKVLLSLEGLEAEHDFE